MPLAPYNCELLTDLTVRHALGGRIGFLGRLWPSTVTLGSVRDTLARHGLFPSVEAVSLTNDNFVNDKALMKLLGYNECIAIDFDDSEGAEITHDLNRVPPDNNYIKYLDVVYNNGTLEHIFNVPNVLNNIFMYLADGGVVIHSAPANNMVEHGFYQFSPTFFYDYYSENNFDILECRIVEHDFSGSVHKYKSWEFRTYDHLPDPLYGKLGGEGKVHDVIFVAR
ncbi:MAG: methyltransferase domain-containing protein, partial [Proteobacteria bacterium]|nr:methyltransferase domain-containing protein [Pseudomonadota bacterium]